MTAAGGQILTSELVAELIGSRGGFRLRRVGRLPLKGVIQPVAAVAVEWEPPPGPGPPAIGGVPSGVRRTKTSRSRGPLFVGRRGELALLDQEFVRLSADGLRCILLVGEAGIGKSRLTTEFVARTHGSAPGVPRSPPGAQVRPGRVDPPPEI